MGDSIQHEDRNNPSEEKIDREKVHEAIEELEKIKSYLLTKNINKGSKKARTISARLKDKTLPASYQIANRYIELLEKGLKEGKGLKDIKPSYKDFVDLYEDRINTKDKDSEATREELVKTDYVSKRM